MIVLRRNVGPHSTQYDLSRDECPQLVHERTIGCLSVLGVLHCKIWYELAVKRSVSDTWEVKCVIDLLPAIFGSS